MVAHRDGDRVAHPEPHLADSASDRVVCLRAVDDHRRIGRHAIRPDVRQGDAARGEQRGERRLGAA